MYSLPSFFGRRGKFVSAEEKRGEFFRKLSKDIDRGAGRDLRALDNFWQEQ